MTTGFLLRGGCVLTLGAKTPNFTEADVLIADGQVTEVGRGLRARDAEVVDAADTIVMPGFVDTHRHAWTSLFRNLGEGTDRGGAPVSSAALAGHVGPDDVYAATLIGLLGAAEAGITSVADRWDLPLDGSSAEAALHAHADAGLRTVFVFAAPDGEDARPALRDLLTRLAAAAGPSTTIALGTGGSGSGDVAWIADRWAVARELGLRIFAHAGPGPAVPGSVAALGGRGLLGNDVTFVHHTQLDDADLDAIAASNASVAFAPSSEMASGKGSPPIQQLLDHDLRPALGIGDERVAPGDMFAQMRATISLQHATVFDRKLMGKAGLPRLMSTRDVIRYATVEGARATGLGQVTGSLEPGMAADIVMLRTDRPNIFPVNDPIGAVVWGMDTSNVDHVFVGGRVVMRDGVLDADLDRIRASATSARDRVGVAAGLVVGAGKGDRA
ncbi:MAG TPA: amidohydrolase family protein [Candidatus Limnocylindrales bacterium]|nr:amidohydrolase family protein [Candidatus Limnocylindrales bacterium]